jgi:putative transposase
MQARDLANPLDALPHGRMKRLSPERYQGLSFVHWTFSIADRRTGWLTPTLHAQFREIQLHALVRYRLLCLSYCLMPDHVHALWAGLAMESDQSRAASFLHKYLGRLLSECGFDLQKQAWDVVLREKQRERGALTRTAYYIVQNPVRKELTAAGAVWPFSGSQAAGYPDLDWRAGNFEERVWGIYEAEVKSAELGTRAVQ